MPNTKEAITCAACEGTGRIHDASCPDKAEHVCETRCEICDGEGMLDYAMVEYWFNQSKQFTQRLRAETSARLDAELALDRALRAVRRAA